MTWEEYGLLVSSLYPDMRNLHRMIGLACDIIRTRNETDLLTPYPSLFMPILTTRGPIFIDMREGRR